jgi:2-hydroxychromene-2-carboxylate isomerase
MTGPARSLRFYFDFISPFGYLASLRIDGLAARHGIEADWRSFLVGVTVMKVMGLKPIPRTPLKGEYARRDAERYCRRHGIRLARPLDAAPLDPLPAGRIFHWLKQHDPARAVPAAKALFHACWAEDRDIGDAEVALAAAAAAGADGAALREALRDGSAAHLLRNAVDAAIAAGVFGSPFFLVDDEPFFGLEKMELLDEWLDQGGW